MSSNQKKRSSKEMDEISNAPKTKKRRLNDEENKDKDKDNNNKNEEIKEEEMEENEDIDINHNNNNNNNNLIKILCYNLNGIRAASKKGLEKYINSENFDIVCFGETKGGSKVNPCNFEKYSDKNNCFWFECKEQSGYSGTAILLKNNFEKPIKCIYGINNDNNLEEGRCITLEFNKFFLINSYQPNSGQQLKFSDKRKKWDISMLKWLKNLQTKKPIIWTGDLNVANLDIDVYDGTTNKNRKKSPGFTDYERENFKKVLKELNLIDCYRHFYPNEAKNHYTFFTARSYGKNMKESNMGWRLDYFVVSPSIISCVKKIEIKKDIGCSDHVPLILTLTPP